MLPSRRTRPGEPQRLPVPPHKPLAPSPTESGNRKRILLLTSRFPFPAYGGDSVRILHLANALAANYELTLLSLCERQPHFPSHGIKPFSQVHTVCLPRWKSYLQTLCAMPGETPLQLAYYRSGAFQKVLNDLLPQHDGVIAHLHRTGQYIKSLPHTIPTILEMTDAISLHYQRVRERGRVSRAMHLVYAAEHGRLMRYERSESACFGQTWLVSPVDIDHLFGSDAPDTVHCIPVPIDHADFPYQPQISGNTMLFIGNMLSAQNQDGCMWFCKAVLPELQRRIPAIRMRIIGAMPPAFGKALAKIPGVEWTGAVAHVGDHLNSLFCGVCPVRTGAGMQNKVLNYFALGLPCVSTASGMEGIDAQESVDFLQFKSPEQAVEQIALLHGSQELRETLRRRAREIAQRYSSEIIYPRIRERAADLFERGGRMRSACSAEPLESATRIDEDGSMNENAAFADAFTVLQ